MSKRREIRLADQGVKGILVRVDFFNALNHAVFYAPNGNMASSAAGRVTGAATARQLQFGFRFSF